MADPKTLKSILAGLKLYHADIVAPSNNIRISTDERPNVVGAPGSTEPPEANLATTQWMLPGATGPDPQMAPLAAANARYEANPPRMQEGLVARLGKVLNTIESPETARYLARGQVGHDLSRIVGQAYTEHGPGAVKEGLAEIPSRYQAALLDRAQRGEGAVQYRDIAPGVNKAIGGAMVSALPLAPAALAPLIPATIAAGIPGTIGALAAHPAVSLAGGLALGHAATKLEGGLVNAGMDPGTAGTIGHVANFVNPEHVLAAGAPFLALSRKAITAAMEKETAEKVVAMLEKNPELANAVKWMHPNETAALARMTPASQAEFARVYKALPENEMLGALFRAGGEKLGWYEHSRAAIEHVFGKDADLFAGILAATSPQNSVEMNLRNATHVYRAWVKANRPTDEASILKIMAANVLGEKGEKSVLQAWKNNTVAVLQGGETLSGPKVDSFWRNLRSRAVETPYGSMPQEHAVTMDAWMSNVLGIRQTYFAGQGPSGKTPAALLAKAKLLAQKNPGYGPGYLASAAKIREAATASGITPEQMQETIWSWGKALYEQAEKTGESAVSIIKRGGLDPKAVSGTPDFSTLFNHPDYQGVIGDISKEHAEKLLALKPATFPTRGIPAPGDHEWQLKAAETLDKLMASRKVSSDLRVGQNAPGYVNSTAPQEGISGHQTGVAPEMHAPGVTPAERDTLGRRMLDTNTDVRGDNILIKGSGLKPAETTTGIGSWTPAGQKQKVHNTLDASYAQLRLAPDGTVLPEDAARFSTATNLQGVMDAQDAVATIGITYDRDLKDTLHVFTKNKITKPIFEDLAKLFPDKKYALVNKGGDTPGYVLDVVRLPGPDGTPIPIGAREEKLIRGVLETRLKTSLNKKGEVVPPKIDITPGSNTAGDYVVMPWKEPTLPIKVGGRKITVRPTDRANLDGQVLVPVDVAKFDKSWAQEPGFHINPQGSNQIGNRLEGVKDFLGKSKTMNAPEVTVDANGLVNFTDGRHRMAYLRDQGLTQVPVSMTRESLANAQKHGLIGGDAKPAGGLGSKQVTRKALEHYDALSEADKAGLDSDAIKEMATAKLRIWDELSARAKNPVTVREDYRNLLTVVSQGGISALRRAVDDPRQLLPVLIALGLARSAFPSQKPSSPKNAS